MSLPISMQEKQDAIFRRMSADEKVRLGAELWHLAKAVSPEKVVYVRKNRSEESSHRDYKNS
jgi:hypothetical protein